MSIESEIRAHLAALGADFVTLNYYGPWKLKLVYGVAGAYYEAESEVVKSDRINQDQLDGLHELQLCSTIKTQARQSADDADLRR